MKFFRKRDNDNYERTIEQEAEFDSLSDEYLKKLDNDISLVLRGNPHEYLTQYKIFHLRRIFSAQKKLTSSDSPLKILDYGCGVGLFAQSVLNSIPGNIIHGFDVSSKSIERVPAEIHTGKNKFTSSLDELDSDYDIAMLITVLHHVLPVSDRPGVMENIYKRLKPGGKLIIIENNMMNPLMNKFVKTSVIDANAIMLSPSECKNLLDNAGFRNIHNKYIEFFPKQVSLLRFLDKFISWLPFGAHYLMTGEK